MIPARLMKSLVIGDGTVSSPAPLPAGGEGREGEVHPSDHVVGSPGGQPQPEVT